MTLKDIGVYKNRLLSAIVNSEDVCELILGKDYDKTNVDKRLIYKNVFPYLYVDETQTKQESYVCIEVDVPRTINFSFKDMKIIIWCYCHKGIMKYSKKEYLGTRADILSDMIDRFLNSSNDFGKNIIPTMLAAGERMYAYPFEGYWKDVGTISSLWEANMDLLGKAPVLSLNDEAWRIYSRHEAHAPQYIGANAVVENCSLTEGCEIYGIVRNSVLGAGVRVMEGAEVCDSVIMGNVTIKAGAKVNYSIVDADVVVGEGCVIGGKRAEANDIAVIATRLEIPAGAVVKAGEMISSVEDIEKEVK